MKKDKIKKIIPASIKARVKSGKYFKSLSSRMTLIGREQDGITLMIGTPIHTNLGDHLITMAQIKFLEDVRYKGKVIEVPTEMYQIYRKRICRLKCVDTVIINGGGWMGNLWVPEELFLQQVIEDFFDKKVIVFPQTIYFDNTVTPYESLINSANIIFAKCKDVTLCVREANSYRFALDNYRNVKIILVPDIALYFFNYAPKNRYLKLKNVGLCLRNDREIYADSAKRETVIDMFKKYGYFIEHVDTMYDTRVGIEQREEIVLTRLKQFANYDYIITDRLHGMIFSYICGTPCIVFDNKTHKVSGVYESWLSKSNNILPVFSELNLNALEGFILRDISLSENVCPTDRFKDLREIL